MLHLISIIGVCSGIGIAIYIFFDLKRRPQSMKIMNVVWVLTALWGSFLALLAYSKIGRRTSMKNNEKMNMPDMDMPMENEHPHWQSVCLSALHCGAGCTLADIIGEVFTKYVPVSIAGSWLAGNWVLDFALALIIGIYFQFYAIREMQKISIANAFIRALKADFFSLLSWQIGMYGWMAMVYFVLFHTAPLPKDTWAFWFMMQIAMLFGFLCAYPMNALLIKLGVKKGM